MRCAACDAECPRDATRCPSCGRPLARRRGRHGPAEEDEPPPWYRAVGSNRTALRAYRFTLLGLVPGFGLLFGPLGAALGGVARARGKRDAAFTSPGPAVA